MPKTPNVGFEPKYPNFIIEKERKRGKTQRSDLMKYIAPSISLYCTELTIFYVILIILLQIIVIMA